MHPFWSSYDWNILSLQDFSSTAMVTKNQHDKSHQDQPIWSQEPTRAFAGLQQYSAGVRDVGGGCGASCRASSRGGRHQHPVNEAQTAQQRDELRQALRVRARVDEAPLLLLGHLACGKKSRTRNTGQLQLGCVVRQQAFCCRISFTVSRVHGNVQGRAFLP